MKTNLARLLLYLTFASFIGSCTKDASNSGVNFEELKYYNLNVQKVKKIHDYFALISPHEIIFLNTSGEKQFSYDDHLFSTSDSINFKFTDVVEHPSGDFYILGTEINKNKQFRLYIIRINSKEEEVWQKPQIITITDSYEYDAINPEKNLYFTNKENGYALGTYQSNELIVIVNYQNSHYDNWRYRMMSFSEDGKFNHKQDFISDIYHVSWTYLIDKLPDETLVVVRGSDSYLDITQYNPITFEQTKVHTIESELNITMFTNMLPWSSSEVVFTGHADRRNNEVVAENFDIFCIKYNFLTNIITDSLFSGSVNNEELSYNSYIDKDKTIHCIGTRRGNLLSTPSVQSNLLMVDFNLLTHNKDSLVYIKNKGYEGLFIEPVNNSTKEHRILGYKLDISGKQNIQGFYLSLKNQ
jgi:hypothetical protein